MISTRVLSNEPIEDDYSETSGPEVMEYEPGALDPDLQTLFGVRRI
jgi:hypothetical protein